MIVQLFDNVDFLKATDRMASDDEFHGWKVPAADPLDDPAALMVAADYADHCEIKEG